MRKFRTVFRMPARARIGRDVGLSLKLASGSGCTVQSLYKRDEHGTSHPSEMQLTILLAAEEAQEAALQARADAKFVASVLSYLANGPVSEPRLILIHEVADGDAPREYHYFLQDPLNLRSTTRVGTAAINDLVAKLDVLESSVRDRVQRAMHWHAVALDLDDRLERVQAILTGFEALNPLLSARLGVDVFEVRRCPSCGAESKAPVASGVHAWLRQECGDDHMRKTRNLRNGLLHGYRPIAELYPMAGDVLPGLEKALMKAIAECSDASEPYRLIPIEPLIPSLPFSMALHGTCSGPVEAAYRTDGSLPEFRARAEIKSSSYDSAEDRVTMVLQQDAIAVLPPGVSVQIVSTTNAREAGVRVESDPVFTITRGSREGANTSE